MIRRPPRSTRTDTLFPYTTLFRSVGEEKNVKTLEQAHQIRARAPTASTQSELNIAHLDHALSSLMAVLVRERFADFAGDITNIPVQDAVLLDIRSDERCLGKECVSTRRSRWSPYK